MKKYKEFRKRKNSSTNEWYTPKDYIESARKVLGGIEVDPASSDKANEIVQADLYYTKETNGLDKKWLNKDGKPSSLFLNPPYGGEEEIWVPKLIKEYNEYSVREAILLVGSKTDVKWFRKLWQYTLCFTRFRIKFTPGEENDAEKLDLKKNQPPCGNVFAYFGCYDSVFSKEFEQYGEIVSKKHSVSDNNKFDIERYQDMYSEYLIS